MNGQIAVLIDATLHNEFVLRSRTNEDVTHIIESVLESFLERTKYDEMWNEEYLAEIAEIEESGQLAKYGDPSKGYLWQTVLLHNGSNLRITYKGRNQFAEVCHGKIMYEATEHSPSEWARRVANNTSRNAWLDIWVQAPGSSQWKSADALRWEQKGRNE